MRLFDKLKEWWNSNRTYCDGCGKETFNVFDDLNHLWNCVDAPLGYHTRLEKFEPSTRAYFFTEKQRRGL